MSFGSQIIYLDHAATTPTDPAVVQAMIPFFSQLYGNPSSIYRVGQDARAAIDRARQQVARVLGVRADEIIFTSGATESIGMAHKGIAWAARYRQPADPLPHIISTQVEHHAVLHTLDALERQGFAISRLPVSAEGIVAPHDVADAIRPETCLISVMYANNEDGAIQPIREIAAIAKRAGIPFHTDAVQAAGTLPITIPQLGVDLLSLSAHKFYGPKGVGLLYVRKGIELVVQQDGGGQEAGRRGGTENVPLIVGLGEALARADRQREDYAATVRQLRDHLWTGIRARLADVSLNGPAPDGPRLPNNLNIAIDGALGETVLLSLDLMGVEASAGSACTTGNAEPSHVLTAAGHSEAEALTSLRLTVGRGNTVEEMDRAADALAIVVKRIRGLGRP